MVKALSYRIYINLLCVPPPRPTTSSEQTLTLSVLHYYLTFSFHLKLALLTQLPTSNERKIPPHLKIKPAKFHNGGFTQDLYMHICSISVKFQLWKNSMNALK